jgi:hypothetical protein
MMDLAAAPMAAPPADTDTGESPLQRTLAALRAAVPGPTARAESALRVLLAGVRASAWPEVAWRFSRLTTSGYPVEFACTSADSALRYTVEVAGPEVAEADRLSRALVLLARLGTPSPPTPLLAELTRIQADGDLRYGAWIGGRHDATTDRFKVYVETPHPESSRIAALVVRLVGRAVVLESRQVRLLMVGYDPTAARTELYFRADGLETWELGRALARAGLNHRLPDLLALLGRAVGRAAEGPLRAWPLGFSLSLPTGEGEVFFSLYTFAHTMFGTDSDVRRRLLALARRQGWDLGHYAVLTEHLIADAASPNCHGMVGFTVGPRDAPHIHVGLRPPPTGPRSALDHKRVQSVL